MVCDSGSFLYDRLISRASSDNAQSLISWSGRGIIIKRSQSARQNIVFSWSKVGSATQYFHLAQKTLLFSADRIDLFNGIVR
jgi:hypothetical protein